MDSRLEVAISREDRRGDQVVLLDRLGDRLGERPAVADAGGAGVAAAVDAELLEVGHQPGAFEVRGHRPRAGRHAGLDPRPAGEAPLDGPLGKEADRKSTRLNSSHGYISYAVFCLKKKKKKIKIHRLIFRTYATDAHWLRYP